MIDEVYRNAFKETYNILQNTEEELINRIPKKFIKFLQNNMNNDYKTNINNNIDLDKQKLLPETEEVLSLIYRSYWATEEEKSDFLKKDLERFEEIEEEKRKHCKSIDEIFKKEEKVDDVIIEDSLVVIKNESFIRNFFKKILSFFHK